jgi:ABC-2 type transport system permease protein
LIVPLYDHGSYGWQILPGVILSLFDTFTVIAVGHFWFGVPVRGSPLLIALLGVILLSGLGIGVCPPSPTQQEAMLNVFMTCYPPFSYRDSSSHPEYAQLLQWISYHPIAPF